MIICNFKIHAIKSKLVKHLFQESDSELHKKNCRSILVDEKPGYPCRISLEDAEIGEVVIAVSFNHHDVNSPYRASGPIFIRDKVVTADLRVNEVPKMLHHRLLSIRAYDSKHIMIDASTVEGENLKQEIRLLFQNSSIQYMHIHNAGPGCYNCRVERVK